MSRNAQKPLIGGYTVLWKPHVFSGLPTQHAGRRGLTLRGYDMCAGEEELVCNLGWEMETVREAAGRGERKATGPHWGIRNLH
jgi:hypothetical protein